MSARGPVLKCHKYWPDNGERMQCGALEVIAAGDDHSNPDFILRKFRLQSSVYNEAREVVHLQMVTWPDQGTPTSPLSMLNYIHEVRAAEDATRARGLAGPTVVHCSAGIGRSGTFMAVDTNLRRLVALGNVDLASTVVYGRGQRSGLVQTLAQYRFCYEAVQKFILETNVGQQLIAARAPAHLVDNGSSENALTLEEVEQLQALAGPDTGHIAGDYILALRELNGAF